MFLGAPRPRDSPTCLCLRLGLRARTCARCTWALMEMCLTWWGWGVWSAKDLGHQHQGVHIGWHAEESCMWQRTRTGGRLCAKENERQRVRRVRLSPVINLHHVVAKLYSLYSCIRQTRNLSNTRLLLKW